MLQLGNLQLLGYHTKLTYWKVKKKQHLKAGLKIDEQGWSVSVSCFTTLPFRAVCVLHIQQFGALYFRLSVFGCIVLDSSGTASVTSLKTTGYTVDASLKHTQLHENSARKLRRLTQLSRSTPRLKKSKAARNRSIFLSSQ